MVQMIQSDRHAVGLTMLHALAMVNSEDFSSSDSMCVYVKCSHTVNNFGKQSCSSVRAGKAGRRVYFVNRA